VKKIFLSALLVGDEATTLASGRDTSAEVTEDAMLGVDDDLVWLHDWEGGRLAPNVLFALRSQLPPDTE
jgi:hypothetical protein